MEIVMELKTSKEYEPCTSKTECVYNYVEKGCRKKKCTRQSRKVIWDMINTLFLTLQLSNLLLLLSFSTRILSNFFE